MEGMVWKSPSRDICKEALIGSSNILKKLYKNTYSPREKLLHSSDFFKPIEILSEADWLMNHNETGQTFESFWRNHLTEELETSSKKLTRPQTAMPRRSINSAKNGCTIPKDSPKIIYIQPLGKFSNTDCDETIDPFMVWLQTYCSAFFQSTEVRILPEVGIGEIKCEYRINVLTSRFQLNASNILNFLKKIKPKDAYCVIGVTMVDLFPKPSWDFVFGLASPSRNVGVFSFVRYEDEFFETWTQGNDEITRNPDGSLNYSAFSEPRVRVDGSHATIDGKLLLRACKVMTHEICHMFGLKHCIYNACLMNGSNHLQESDRRPAFLCPVCLRKLQSVLNFNVLERYKAILNWSSSKFWENYLHYEQRKTEIVKLEKRPPIWERRTSLPDTRPRTAARKYNKVTTGARSKITVISPKPTGIKPASTVVPKKGSRVMAPTLDSFSTYCQWINNVIKYLEEES